MKEEKRERRRDEAELRDKDWRSAEALAEAGYDWGGSNTPGTRIERLEQVIREFKDSLIERFSLALRRGEERLVGGEAEKHLELVDGVVMDAVGLLIERIGGESSVSPVGLEMMELEGFLTRRVRGEGAAWAQGKSEMPRPRGIDPGSDDIRDRKGRALE